MLLKGLIVAKRVKKFLACYGIHKSIEPVVPLLSYLNSIHSLKVASFKGRFNIYLLNLRLLMSYIYGAPILDVSRSHTRTHHSR